MATLDTHGLLCPACKVIIDYGAVSAAATGVASAARTDRLRAVAAMLARTAEAACQAEVAILTQNQFSQAQFDRMHKLWSDSCDRAALMSRWFSALFVEGTDERGMSNVMLQWNEEMQRVPREIAQGKVPA